MPVLEARRPASEATIKPLDFDVAEVFHDLAGKWKAETGILSDITKKSTHWSYQQIIGLGPAAVPLILGELQKKPTDWFWALTAITREDPIAPEHAGNIAAMANDWIVWGKERGLA